MLQKPDLSKPIFMIFNPKGRIAILEDKCPSCTMEICESDFKDAISKKEYSISGLCQTCQNLTFGEKK